MSCSRSILPSHHDRLGHLDHLAPREAEPSLWRQAAAAKRGGSQGCGVLASHAMLPPDWLDGSRPLPFPAFSDITDSRADDVGGQSRTRGRTCTYRAALSTGPFLPNALIHSSSASTAVSSLPLLLPLTPTLPIWHMHPYRGKVSSPSPGAARAHHPSSIIDRDVGTNEGLRTAHRMMDRMMDHGSARCCKSSPLSSLAFLFFSFSLALVSPAWWSGIFVALASVL